MTVRFGLRAAIATLFATSGISLALGQQPGHEGEGDSPDYAYESRDAKDLQPSASRRRPRDEADDEPSTEDYGGYVRQDLSVAGTDAAYADRTADVGGTDAIDAGPSMLEQDKSGGGAAEPADAKPEDKGYTVGSDLTFKATWNNGFEVETPNKDFRIHVGGRTQFDTIWLDSSPGGFEGAGGVGDADSFNFRRARLRVDGTFYEVIDFAAEYDFVNSVNDNAGLQPADEKLGNVIHATAPTDLWWNFKELPFVGNFRIGCFKEPMGFEHLTSSRYLDFMERSFNQDAFTGPFNNGFAPGMMIYDTVAEERGTWAVGLFKNVNNIFQFGVGDGENAVTARGTWLPWYDEPSHGRYLMHVGISGSHRDLDDGRMRIRSRGSLRNGPGVLNPVFADTGFIGGDSQNLLGAEFALQLGSLLLQSEYFGSNVNNAALGGGARGAAFFQGYYVEALYFLTGEHKNYERKNGAFARVIPYTNAYWVRSPGGRIFMPGAWQLTSRFSKLDLRDSGIDGGVIQDVTVGVNWFLNPNMKFQWNYVFMHRDAPGAPVGGDVHGFGMRLAHDF